MVNSHNNIIGSILDIFKLNIVSKLQTGNYIIDMLLATSLIAMISFITNLISKSRVQNYSEWLYLIKEFFWKNNSVIIEGRRCIKSGAYSTRSDQLFSNRFRALWHYIGNNINYNETIYSIKEYAESVNSHDQFGSKITNKNNKDQGDIYVVKQSRSFLLDKDIYCQVTFFNEEMENGSKTVCKIETITLRLFSSVKKLSELQVYIDNITSEFMINIETCRWDKNFIYTLVGNSSDDEKQRLSVWEECPFNSSRTFDNLFFDNKSVLIEKLQFFINNKDWYDIEGHPYTLGIALYGPPGTGKTSVIKCIANMLNRHLIVIPLNKIKTQRDFTRYYFENQYNKNNRAGTITFEKKIIVLDDIDCMTDLIKSRNKPVNNENNITKSPSSDMLLKVVSETVKAANSERDPDILRLLENKEDDAITLSFLLNIIDGIRETPGRILIVTSNYYNQIDEALRRPGRIDFPLEMKNASKSTICQMFSHYYNQPFPDKYMKNLKDDILSPAQIVNLRLQTNNSDNFIELLINKIDELNHM